MSSQVVEVAIGLSVTFFFVALIASGVVESLAKVLKKRATNLEGAIEHLLGGHDVVSELKRTSVYRALQGGSAGGDGGKAKSAKPSYMSARAFADATVELVAKTKARVATDAAAAQNVVNACNIAPEPANSDRLVDSGVVTVTGAITPQSVQTGRDCGVLALVFTT